MLKHIKKNIKKVVAKSGYTISRIRKEDFSKMCVPEDMGEDFKKIYDLCKEYTMTSAERMFSLYQSVQYIVKAGIAGDFVECGVWRGGSSMLMALTLYSMGQKNKKIYLYDTFTGMTKPTEKDKKSDGTVAMDQWIKQNHGEYNEWVFSPIEEVKQNMLSIGYPKENIIFVQGKVEETIPKTIPYKIALLRLDTDWYESTYHELKFLFPLVSPKGVLIIDDYGHWSGAREATDTYLNENKISLLLNRIDYTARLGVKII